MTEVYRGRNVLEAAVDRCYQEMIAGNRMIFTVSGGKDSTVMLETGLMAARKAGQLPIEVMFRDDEILYPDTVDYLMRLAARPEIKMHWIVNKQAAPNIFNRELPFYWCFDPELPPEKWVREYPEFATVDLDNINLYYMVNPVAYAPEPGKKVVSVVGIRTEESRHRAFAIMSNKGAKSFAAKDPRMISLYSIYDWKVGDVWKAIKEFKWDYNRCYDVLYKMGLAKKHQRLSQIAMAVSSTKALQKAAQAWPRWFDKVCDRLPGIRTVVNFGDRSLRPIRYTTETWEQCFQRSCIDTAPQWIAERSTWARNRVLANHAEHAKLPLPDVTDCGICAMSWRRLAWSLYHGDPFHIELMWMPDVEPSIFRPSETRYWPKSHIDAKKKVTINVA